MHINEGQRADLRLLEQALEQLGDKPCVDLAVNELQFFKVMGEPLLEDRDQIGQTLRVHCVHLVDYRFEIFQFVQAFKDHGELITRDAAVVEENSVHNCVVEKSARGCQPSTVAIRQVIVVQTECLLVNLVENGKHQALLHQALLEVLDPRIQVVNLTMTVQGQLTLFVLFGVFVHSHEVSGDVRDCLCFFFQGLVEHRRHWQIFSLLARLLLRDLALRQLP